MKRILGLDLGITSIGWAVVEEAETPQEKSALVKTGVRVIPLSTDEQQDFEKGRSITTNAERTLKRGMRRNLHRYKMRRAAVIELLKEIGFITPTTVLTETGKNVTFSTYEARAKAPKEKISKENFVRVLLMLNKKRGYKSSRKANNQEEGQLIDGMEVARTLYDENLTPGQHTYQLLKEGKKALPDYYRSDLEEEFKKIWNYQKLFYPEILREEHIEALKGKNKKQTSDYFEKILGITRAENKGSNKKIQPYEWRNTALLEQLDLPKLAFILTEINTQINQSSGYLGAISDRSKALYFQNLTVGQYLYHQLKQNPHASLKNQVFYRQDYKDEFDAIWKEQAKHYPELTDSLREKLEDYTIFYQRRLKSQKGLINLCELEGKEREVIIDGKPKKKLLGPRVAPKSSPVFQECKIWQNINAIKVTKRDKDKETPEIEEETKQQLFQELNWVEKMTDTQCLRWLFKDSEHDPKAWKLNFRHLEGNRTNAALLNVYKTILELEGYDINFKSLSAPETIQAIKECFTTIGIDPAILDFDATLAGNAFVQQPAYELWHLLYSYEEDDSTSGINALLQKLQRKFGFTKAHARLLANVTFSRDYGNLSARAMRKILPHLQDGALYSDACTKAGYNHSNAMTKEENAARELKPMLDLLPKNSLRNPVVEKILNQMIHVVNALMDEENNKREAAGQKRGFHFDEIRVELARELKKTAQQRSELTSYISKVTKEHEAIRKKLKQEFDLSYVSRKDVIKYKLYKELEKVGHKTLYSGTYIKPKELFTNTVDVEHIIPQALLFDDSFSNKTLELREVNLEKGKETAYDYCERKGWLEAFKNRVEALCAANKISYTKRTKLLMTQAEIPEDFLHRDLGNSAYIAKKAAALLQEVTRTVTPTSGKITARLREDWGLVDVLKELNFDKHKAQGLTYSIENRQGKKLTRIAEWTKRNDHRHHAMDAIAVAFTRRACIQHLNNENAKSRQGIIDQNIEEKYIEHGKFVKPFAHIREEAKKHLEAILVSHKSKNKVVTQNKNKIKRKGKDQFSIKTERTPRGQLHKETIYGSSQAYSTKLEKVGSSFTQEKIATVASKKHREALQQRLEAFENNPKKAFTGKNSLAKNPIRLNGNGAVLPEKVKTVQLERQYTIRKEITPDLNIDKVIDVGVQRILKKRLAAFNGDAKAAFSNLDNTPIWLNEEKNIPLKRVAITGVSNAQALHTAKDHLGNAIIDDAGNPIPVDYVSTGNNHHVAIYRDNKGNLQEEVVSFYEAVARKNLGQPIINKQHEKGWAFLFTMKQNEMFVFPAETFNPDEIDLLDPRNKTEISNHLFRVQKISTKIYYFRHHLETDVKDRKELKDITWVRTGPLGIEGITKVRLNHLGDIVQVGEY